MSLIRVRNIPLYHSRECAVNKPRIWVYTRHKGSHEGAADCYLVEDFIADDCDCRGKGVSPNAVIIWVGAVIVGIVLGLMM